MDDYTTLWTETKQQLKDSLPADGYRLLQKMECTSIEDGKAVIAVLSSFVRDNSLSYKAAIESVLSQKYGSPLSIEFVVDSNIVPPPSFNNRVKTTDKVSQTTQKKANPTLNSNYRLDNFIPGENAAMAYKAAEVIARNPGTSAFNPCLIYGGVGLGKTHLLQAIGNYIYDDNPNLNVVYVTAENFTNSFIESIGKTENMNKFRKLYRNADVLLIDDIHFLLGKESTQEELFHTFVQLHNQNKQIVFTCDRPATELTKVTERLKTRFTSGLNVDLQPPTYETRYAIARQKCKELNLDLPEDVLDYICQNVTTNVRDLEGSLKTVHGFASLIGQRATVKIAKENLKSIIKEPTIASTNYTISDVFTATANYFNVSIVDIKGTSRRSDIKIPRQIAIYIAYKYGHFTQSDIGKFVSKDHTSIRYSYEQIDSKIDVDDGLKNSIEAINRTLMEKSK